MPSLYRVQLSLYSLTLRRCDDINYLFEKIVPVPRGYFIGEYQDTLDTGTDITRRKHNTVADHVNCAYVVLDGGWIYLVNGTECQSIARKIPRKQNNHDGDDVWTVIGDRPPKNICSIYISAEYTIHGTHEKRQPAENDVRGESRGRMYKENVQDECICILGYILQSTKFIERKKVYT